jgi:hypothetical protein
MIAIRLKYILGLQFQLEGINYAAANFLHANMSPEQLFQAMRDRGDTPIGFLWKLIKLSFDPKLRQTLDSTGIDPGLIENMNPLMVLLRGPTEAERSKLKLFMAHGLLGG